MLKLWVFLCNFFLFRKLFASAAEGYVLYKRAGERLVLNPKARALLGDVKTLSNLQQHIAPEDLGILGRLQASILAGKTRMLRLHLMRKEGKVALRIYARPLTRRRGVLFVRAVPLYLQMESKAENFINFIDALPAPVVIRNAVHKLDYVNDACLDWLGFERGSLNLAELESLLTELEGDVQHTPHTFSLKDRQGYACKGTLVRRIALDDGEREALFIEPKAREIAPKSMVHYSLFLEKLPMPALFLDHQGMIVLVNRAFEHLVRERKILGRPLEGWLEESMHKRYGNFLKKARRESGKEQFLLTKLTTKNPIFMRLYASYISGVDWDPMGCFLVFLYDVTDLKKREEQSWEAQKLQALGQLASGISHDFNNLLTAMLGFCDLLLQKHSPQDSSFTDIMQIKQNANRAANLIRQLLLFARQTKPSPQMMNLRECLNEMSFLLRRLIGVGIELKMHHDREVREVFADQAHIEQVVMNLAVNARDAMPRGGVLTFRTRLEVFEKPCVLPLCKLKPGTYVIVEVEDTGCGISEQNMAKIFDPFFSTKEDSGGTGLGLSTVFQIVAAMKGGVKVSSTLGEGTRFTLYFPKTVATVSSRAPVQSSTTQVNTHLLDVWDTSRILIVEDEDPVRLFVARGLKGKGYQVLDARDGIQGLDLMKRNQDIRLLISDVMMPGMDGPSLVNACYEHNPNLEVILVSGYPDESIREKLRYPKAQVHFLPKPFNLDELLRKVSEVLMERRALA